MNDGSLSPSQSDLRDNSRPLDAHKWSEWPEVNQFIDEIYSSYFQKNEQTNIRKKHVKLLLLDLYVAWKEGWKYVGMSFDVNHYKPKSRYNGLNISKKVIEVAYRLEELDLIRIHSGFKNRDTGEGYVSRLERTANLISRFMDARFPEGAIRCDWDREPVILKDEEKNKSEYKDTPATRRMRVTLNNYNTLLRKTYVDLLSSETTTHQSQRRSLNPDRSAQ